MISFYPPPRNHYREQSEQKPRAPPVELWHIPLGRQLYYLFLHPHIHHGIAFHACAPSVTPFHPREIHRISSLPLAHIHAISQIDRIATYTPLDETRSIVALRDGHRPRAAATHARKEYCSQAQYQDESP